MTRTLSSISAAALLQRAAIQSVPPLYHPRAPGLGCRLFSLVASHRRDWLWQERGTELDPGEDLHGYVVRLDLSGMV